MATLKSTWLPLHHDAVFTCVTVGLNEMLVVGRNNGGVSTKLDQGQWVSCPLHSMDKAKIARSIACNPDGSYVAVFANKTYCTRAVLTSGYWFGEWAASHLAIVNGRDGILIGVTDAGVQTSTSFKGPWCAVPNSGGMISATQLSDGTVLGVGKDNIIYAWDTLNGKWAQFDDTVRVVSLAEWQGRLVAVTTDGRIFFAELEPAAMPAGSLPIPSYYAQKIKLLSDSFTEVGNNILLKGSYEVRFSETEVRLDVGFLALIEVEIPAAVSADWKVTPKRVLRNVGILTPGGSATREFSFEQSIGKDELLHPLHSTRAFNDASMTLSMRLKLIPTIQAGEIASTDVVVLEAAAQA